MNKKLITIFILVVLFVVIAVNYSAPLLKLYDWYTKTESFRLLTDEELFQPEIFYLSPHTVAGDILALKDIEQRDDNVANLSDIPELFQPLIWSDVIDSSDKLMHITSTKNFSKGFSVSVAGMSWKGKIAWGNSKQKRKDMYDQFIEYYAREFYSRGWDWSIKDEDRGIAIRAGYSSGLSRTFVDRDWVYLAQKDDMVRFISFRFDKESRSFIIFLSDTVLLSDILK